MPDDDRMPHDTLEEDQLAATLWYEIVDSLVDEGHSVLAAIEVADALVKIRGEVNVQELGQRLQRAAAVTAGVSRSGWPLELPGPSSDTPPAPDRAR